MGIVYMLIASLLYGIAPSVQKVLLLRGVTPLALVVVCSGFAGPVCPGGPAWCAASPCGSALCSWSRWHWWGGLAWG